MRRREMLKTVASLGAIAVCTSHLCADDSRNIPLLRIDFHAHRDDATLEDLCAIAAKKNVKLGIVEHAGTKENIYPIVLSNDEELLAYIATVKESGCFAGVQAEWLDWSGCFSASVLAKLDYALGDAMTVPSPGGKRVKLWENYEIGDVDQFMDMYAEFHVEVISTQPLDILANPTWLPDGLMPRHAELWTEKRLRPILDALDQRGMALEINSRYHLPGERLLAMGKEAGIIFSFGSNGRGNMVGEIDYCLEMAKKYDITAVNLFDPSRRSATREG